MPRRRFRRSRGCGALRVGSAWRLERIIFDVCGAPKYRKISWSGRHSDCVADESHVVNARPPAKL